MAAAAGLSEAFDYHSRPPTKALNGGRQGQINVRKRVKQEFPSCGPDRVVAILGHSLGLWSSSDTVLQSMHGVHAANALEQSEEAQVARTMLYGVALARWQYGVLGTDLRELVAMRAGFQRPFLILQDTMAC